MSKDIQFSTGKTIMFSMILMTLTLVLLELGAYGVLLATGRGETIPRFHPLFRAQTDFTDNAPRLFDPLYIYRLAPGQPYNAFIDINEQGIIHNGHPVDLLTKPPGSFRIVMFGGSTVAGTGASSNRGTIPAILERKLRDAGMTVEVINAGADGYTSMQEVVYFAADMVHHQPDMVIFYDGVNDFTNPVEAGGYIDQYRRRFHKGSFQEYGAYLVRKFKSIGSPLPAILNMVRNNSYLARLIIGGARKALGWQADFIPENVRKNDTMVRIEPDEAVALYLANVQTALGAARGHGLKVISALQPTLLDKPTRTGALEKRVMTGDDPFDAKAVQFWSMARKGFADIASRANGPDACVLDVSQVFATVTEEVFTGGVHVNDRGNELIADALLPHVRALVAGTGCRRAR